VIKHNKLRMKIKKFLLSITFLFIYCSAVFYAGQVYAVDTQADKLTIIQVSDTHIDLDSKNKDKRMLGHSCELLKTAVARINAMPVDVVIFSGDIVNTSQEKNLVAFTKIAGALKHPWYVALGNHDIAHDGDLTKARFYALVNQANPYEHNKSSYFSFVPKAGYLIVVMDGVIDKHTSHGYFPPDELRWLAKQLDYYAQSKVVIVQHFPLVEPAGVIGHEITDKEEYLSLLDHHPNVVAVLSGHYHQEKVMPRGKVTHVSAPALIQLPSRIALVTVDRAAKVSASFVTVTQD